MAAFCSIFHFIVAGIHCGLFGKMVLLYIANGKICGAADVVALYEALEVCCLYSYLCSIHRP